MPESQDADALILAMAGGDEAAFAELWRILGGPVQRLAAGFLGSQADGDDIAQATFLKAWRSASAFDPAKGSGRAWIFSIARN
ncbi:MAG: sigma factor, partial [Pseudomonadota bacterium]